jgi:membrane-associated protease RseP (regulator of RpoE activity)
MNSHIEMSVSARARRFILTIGSAACLTLILGPVQAAGQEEESRTVVKRPVVVVQSDTHGSGFTWTTEGHRSFLGVSTLDLTPELREHFGVPREAGVLVARIVDDSPAAQSDLLVGDIIGSLNGETIVSPADLASAVGHRSAGDIVDLEVWREGQLRLVQSTLVEREGPWIDIRQIRLPEGEFQEMKILGHELDGTIELKTETFNKAIERLNQELDSPDWHEKVHSFTVHQGSLMKRIEILEQRLRELEAELQDLPAGD